MEELNWIKNHLISIATVISACATIIGFIHKFLKQFHDAREAQMDQAQLEREELKKQLDEIEVKLKEREEYMRKQREMNLAILHDRILELCKKYLTQKRIDINEYTALKRMYESYADFDGNGIITNLVADVGKMIEV